MTCFNKEYYKDLKANAKRDNVVVYTTKLNDEYPYNGYSIAFTKPRDGLRMIQVSVSYCSPEDKYKRKHGKYHALRRLYNGESLMLPLGNYSVEAIKNTLEDMFLVY